jgi:uncharacterized membrane protein
LTWADNELNWRADKIMVGPGGIIDRALPFTVTYLVIRDIIASAIYIVAIGANVVLFSRWQTRGDRAEAKRKALAEGAASPYGRPLVRKAEA